MRGGKRPGAGRKPLPGAEVEPTHVVAFRITPVQARWLTSMAQAMGCSKSNVLRGLLEQGISKYQQTSRYMGVREDE